MRNQLSFFIIVIINMFVCACVHFKVPMWRPENNSWESVLSYHGFQGSKSVARIVQALLSTEPSYWPRIDKIPLIF